MMRWGQGELGKGEQQAQPLTARRRALQGRRALPAWLRPRVSEGADERLSQGGFCTADRIVTVSPGYAYEIQTPEGGWGMESLLRSRAYALNGELACPHVIAEVLTMHVSCLTGAAASSR